LSPPGERRRKSDAADPVRVGVLSLHNSKETKAILNAVEDLGHEPVWLRRENAAVGIEDSAVTLEPDVDVIANRLLLSNTEAPAEGLGLAATFNRIRPMLNPPGAVLTAIHKFATAATLAEWNVRVPDALLALSNDRLNEGRERFGDVGVYKTAIGTHGGGTWKVDLTGPVNPKVGNRQASSRSTSIATRAAPRRPGVRRRRGGDRRDVPLRPGRRLADERRARRSGRGRRRPVGRRPGGPSTRRTSSVSTTPVSTWSGTPGATRTSPRSTRLRGSRGCTRPRTARPARTSRSWR